MRNGGCFGCLFSVIHTGILLYMGLIFFSIPLILFLAGSKSTDLGSAIGRTCVLINVGILVLAEAVVLFALLLGSGNKAVAFFAIFAVLYPVVAFCFSNLVAMYADDYTVQITVTALNAVYLLTVLVKVYQEKNFRTRPETPGEKGGGASGSGRLLWGEEEERRIARKTDNLLFSRWIGMIVVALPVFFILYGIIRHLDLPGTDENGMAPVVFAVLIPLVPLAFAGYRYMTKADPDTYMGNVIRTGRPYTVNRLHSILWNADTMFGTPGIAWVRGHGKVLLYGPTDIGVYVFVVPSLFRRRVYVRLMSAPSMIRKYSKYLPAYTVEINERLNGEVKNMDFEAVLGPMSAEIARLLTAAEDQNG